MPKVQFKLICLALRTLKGCKQTFIYFAFKIVFQLLVELLNSRRDQGNTKVGPDFNVPGSHKHRQSLN